MPAVTAGLRPELFAEWGAQALSRKLIVAALALLVLVGFGFRLRGLGFESLSEDELNKYNAVADYRAHGITAANGEHPFLMKAMQTISIIAAERWNSTSLASSHAELRIPFEAALRFPNALFGALTAIVLYMVAAELFGAEIALIAAAFWIFDPSVIAFNRVAKEDTFLVFFFLLGNLFWLRSQRVAETGGRPERYTWAAVASFGAMTASKYIAPQYFAGSIAYYYIFQGIPQTRWRMGKRRFLIFFLIMIAVFLVLNPTILLPGTWREMLAFASYQRIGHAGYEFLGQVYKHKLTDWLGGVPWYFYLVLLFVKLAPLTITAFLVGLPLVFRRRLGDGRYALFFWTLIGFLPFLFMGGKFTRYFAPELPVVLITAAIGAQFAGRLLARTFKAKGLRISLRALPTLLVILFALWADAGATPHYRLYTNLFGGGSARAGTFFPQDEFYDAAMREVMAGIAERAGAGARVASETPGVAAFYAQQAGRADLSCVLLSDPAKRKELVAGDFLIAARGRRYFSNEALLSTLRQAAAPTFSVSLDGIPAADVYQLDESTLALIASHTR